MSTTQHTPTSVVIDPRGTEMLLHEDLARARMREAQRAAESQRLARMLSSARRWERLAAWAQRRAAKARSVL
jgi:hypothetical protein